MSIVPLLMSAPTLTVSAVVLAVLLCALFAVRGIGKARPHS